MTVTSTLDEAGRPLIKAEGRALHSLRNPEREAQRVVEAQLAVPSIYEKITRDRPIMVWVLDPPHTHAFEAVHVLYPRMFCIGIFSDRNLREAVQDQIRNNQQTVRDPANPEKILLLHHDGGRHLWEKLSSLLPHCSVLQVRIVDWPASSVLPGHDRLKAQCLDAVKDARSQLLTRLHFGPQWIRNVRRNRRHMSNLKGDVPAVPIPSVPEESHNGWAILAASGPTLTRLLESLETLQLHADIIALPSSLRALRSANIIPRFAVTLDAGYWAQVHLRHLHPGTTLIAALTSRIPAGIFQEPYRSPIWYSYFSPMFDYPTESAWFRLPERGSVLFNAIDLAALLGYRNLVLAGADFQPLHLRSHVHPHSFDEYLYSRTDRLHSILNDALVRASAGQLTTYHRWFTLLRSRQKSWPRLFQLEPAGAETGLPLLGPERLVHLISQENSQGTNPLQIPVKTSVLPDLRKPGLPLKTDIFSSAWTEYIGTLISGSAITPGPDTGSLALLEYLTGTIGLPFKDYYSRWLAGEDESMLIGQLDEYLRRNQESDDA